jgi:hypothetical protein
MKILPLLPFLLVVGSFGQNVATSDDGSQVLVIRFRWTKSSLTVEQADSAIIPAPSAMIPPNRNFERNRRVNSSPGERDLNADTLDGRSAALEKSIQASRAPKPINGFSFLTKIKNNSAKVIEVMFWEYQFHDPVDPASVSRRQFLCGVNIKPGKEKDLEGFSLLGPADVISVESLGTKNRPDFQEKAVINRVEYADGSVWQRKGWNAAEVKASYARVMHTPWHPDTCKGL